MAQVGRGVLIGQRVCRLVKFAIDSMRMRSDRNTKKATKEDDRKAMHFWIVLRTDRYMRLEGGGPSFIVDWLVEALKFGFEKRASTLVGWLRKRENTS